MKNSFLNPDSGSPQAGFTRIELFVILSCLSLLALTQLPLLGKSREGSHEAVCMNNMRQLGLALLMYSDENQDIVPEEGSLTSSIMVNPDAWYNLAVQPYFPAMSDLYQTNNIPLPGNGTIYSCPSAAPPTFTPDRFAAFFMYGMNARICINKTTRSANLPNTRISNIPQPVNTIFMAELDSNSLGQASPSALTGFFAIARHQGLGFFVMADGHMRAARTNEFSRTSAEANNAATEWIVPRKMYWYPTSTTPN